MLYKTTKMKQNTIFLLGLLLFIIQTQVLGQIKSYLPPKATNCLVLLEKKFNGNFVPHATGFLLQSYYIDAPVTVVTNEHVLRNRNIYVTVPADSNLVQLMRIRKKRYFNIDNTTWEVFGNKLRHDFKLIPDSTFAVNKDLDIGVFNISIGNSTTIDDSIEIKVSSIIALGSSSIKYKKDIPLGTNVFFVGFPFFIGTELGFMNNSIKRMYAENVPNPLVRSGSIAWISDNNDSFLLDAFSYPGNSGSPVITISDIQNRTYIIGIVSGHLSATGNDNIGLANCVWMDDIIELIEKLE